jgi:hypothetical protein
VHLTEQQVELHDTYVHGMSRERARSASRLRSRLLP